MDPNILCQKGDQTAPQPLKISGNATTGLLDNRWEQVLGYAKTSGDVTITWLWRHQYEENFTKKWKKVDFLKPIFRPEGSVLGQNWWISSWKIIVWAFRISTSKVDYLFPSPRYRAIKIRVFRARIVENYKIGETSCEAPSSP